MTTDNAILNRQALALFNWIGTKHQNDKHIGDLTIGDFIEMCGVLADVQNIEVTGKGQFYLVNYFLNQNGGDNV